MRRKNFMIKNIIKSKRYIAFSKADKDIVQAGVELYKHYLFNAKKKDEYREFASQVDEKGNAITYEEKEKIFNASLEIESIKRSGLVATGFSKERLARHPLIRSMKYELLSEIIDTIFPQTLIDDFGQFAEVRNGQFDDNFIFHIPNPNLFTVSKAARGIRNGQPQRLMGQDLVLTPVPNTIDIEDDYEAVLCGKSNFGEWITKVALSMQTQMSIDVYNAMTLAVNAQPTSLQIASGAFTEKSVMQLAARITAANQGAQATLLGTKAALTNLLPNNDYLKVELGQMVNDIGYVSNFRGIPAIAFDDRLVPNDPNLTLAIDQNTVYVVSLGSQKPIKICLEGDTIITEQTTIGDNAMDNINYHIEKRYVVGAASAARVGSIAFPA
jgi:hypothetical protein